MISNKVLIVSSIILFISIKLVHQYLTTMDNDHIENHQLYLTPIIEDGNLYEARKLAAVNHKEMFDVKSYSGYLTVDKQHNSNLFFWYFPSETDLENAPILLWLQGGPGATSLWALFYQNGPFKIHDNRTLSRRQHSYSTNHNLIYIDSPVGTGYSFTDNDHGHARTESKVYEDLYSGLLQFYQLFSELQSNPLFISGECYSGKYIPAFSYMIHQRNPTAKIKINLKGLAIGNGFVDPVNQMNYGDYLYHLGLLDLNGRNQFHLYEEKIRSLINNNDHINAAKVFDELLFTSPSVLSNLTGFKSYFFNYLHNENPDDWDALVEWIQRSDVRAAIHVRNDTPLKIMNYTIMGYLQHEFTKSRADEVAALLPYYKIMFYNGQLDILIPYFSLVNVVLNLQWDGVDDFKKAHRSIWYSDNDLAGYVTKVGNISVVLVRNAGHTVGVDQPKWALDMITQFTYH